MKCDMANVYKSGAGVAFNPRTHLILETPWIDSVRRSANRDNLALIYFKRQRTYGVVVWVFEPDDGRGPGYFIELETFHTHPDKFTKQNRLADVPSILTMRARCQPVGGMMKDFEQQLLSEEYEENRRDFNSDAHLKEVVKWLRGKGKLRSNEIADKLESGELPFYGGDDKELNDFVEALSA